MRDLDQYGEEDRREVDPPVEVQVATWSAGGQLDWWVKERREWWVAYAVRTVVNGGSAVDLRAGPETWGRRSSRPL
jgi:hypothetical protein